LRNTRDSFLKHLQTELTGITIHPLVVEPSYPESSNLQLNAVNVGFIRSNYSEHISKQEVSIDVVYEDELVGLDVLRQVFEVLRNNFILMFDYTIPSAPVEQTGQIYWDMNSINFRQVPSVTYSHFNCTFTLKFNITF
jgi:hypothetical protein